MQETQIDRDAMGRLANALAFIIKADDPAVVALRLAAETGTEKDIKQARTMFLRLKPQHRQAAMTMLSD